MKYFIANRLLTLCDKLRDEKLPEQGVLLEDKDGRTVVKYVGKEMALKEKQMKAKILAEKLRSKEEERRKQDKLKVGKIEIYVVLLIDFHTAGT